MTPRLLLLTGPAAGDVSNEFRLGAIGEVKGAVRDAPWWNEVRDYLDAPRSISDQFCGCKTVTPEGIKAASWRAECMDRAIRSLPGGEEWLVGLVMPPTPPYIRLPPRLAILAPDPPPLLVERVRQWCGGVWYCVGSQGRCCIGPGFDGGEHDPDWEWLACADTWPKAVRAALGEP